MARKVKLWAREAEEGSALLQVDLKNAFNSVDRRAILAQVAARAPGLLSYAQSCYNHSTTLFGQGFVVESTRGIQQGDVCGPVLFSITIQQVLLRLESMGLQFQYWYLDDGLLCGSASVLREAFKVLKDMFGSMGLTVNSSKCRIFSPSADFPMIAELSDIPVVLADGGITVLGVPVGSEDSIRHYLEQRREDLVCMLSRLKLLDSALAKFLLLRACLGVCRIIFLLRSVEFRLGTELAVKTQVMVRQALADILGKEMDDTQFGLACARVHKGGLGLQDPVASHGPAFLGSSFTFATSADTLPLSFWKDVDEAWSWTRGRFGLDTSILAALGNIEGNPEINKEWTQQQWWQGMVDLHAAKSWESRASVRMRALKHLGGARFCSDVTSLLGSTDGESELSSRAWSLCMRYRLGVPLDDLDSRACPGCGSVMDSQGDHALCCARLGSYARHNDLRNKFAALCQESGLRVELERGPVGSTLRPADVLVHGLDSSPVAVDFSVVHALQPSCALADVLPGKMAAQVERIKRRENAGSCQRAGWVCQPFVVEAVGAWGGGARFLTQRLVRQFSLKQGCGLQEAGRECQTVLGSAVLRAVCRQLERGFPSAEELEPLVRRGATSF